MQHCPQLLPLLGGGSTNTAEATYHELMHPLSHLVNAVLSTASAPAGGRSTNIAEATYHELMHPLSHLVNAVLSTAPAPAGGGDQLTLLKPHTMS